LAGKAECSQEITELIYSLSRKKAMIEVFCEKTDVASDKMNNNKQVIFFTLI
jgi:hypothetical protein